MVEQIQSSDAFNTVGALELVNEPLQNTENGNTNWMVEHFYPSAIHFSMMNEEPKLTPRILEVPVLSNVVRFRPSSVGSQADARGILPRREMNDLGFIFYG